MPSLLARLDVNSKINKKTNSVLSWSVQLNRHYSLYQRHINNISLLQHTEATKQTVSLVIKRDECSESIYRGHSAFYLVMLPGS